MTIPAAIENLAADDLWTRLQTSQDLIDRGLQNEAALINALQHANAEIRWRVLALLGDMGAIDAIPAIIAALSDDVWAVRHTATYALGQFAQPQANAALNFVLHNAVDEQVRYVAAMALLRIGDDEALQMLENAAQSPIEGVCRAATAARHLNLYH